MFQAGLTTAQIDWMAINNAPTMTWPFSEWASPTGAVERAMIERGGEAATITTRAGLFARANS